MVRVRVSAHQFLELDEREGGELEGEGGEYPIQRTAISPILHAAFL